MLKVYSRCDLACNHCYIYEHVDQTWRNRPRVMAAATVSAVAMRIAEHAEQHGLRRVHVVLHGGEPLLMGPARLAATLGTLRETIGPVSRLDLRMQSNGVRLTGAMCDVLLRYDVRIGISFDGDRAANDRHRVFRGGASSYEQTRRALRLLRRPRYRPLYAGILCTVDIDNDPIAVYRALVAEQPPHLDLLLPHATWDRPPPSVDDVATPYAAWLLAVYHRWVADGCPVPIRLFDSVRRVADGGHSGTEAVGVDSGDLVVVEADGAWEQPDSMKTAFHGAGSTGFTVFTHSVNEVAAHPQLRHRQAGLSSLSATCRSCPVVDQCGGGLYAHRYRTGTGFDNPSVYCRDLKALIVSMNASPPPSPPPSQPPSPPPPTGEIGGLPPPVLDDLASGYGDRASLSRLRSAQQSLTRVLLVAVADRLHRSGLDASTARAWSLLGQLDRTAPDAVHAVLAHPFVRPWAVNCLNSRGGTDRHRLACLVAAAAIRARAAVELALPVSGGQVHLPTLGTAVLPDGHQDAVVVSSGPDGFQVRWAAGSIHVRTGDPAPVDGWLPVRHIVADDLDVLLEDGDPYRDCHDWPAMDRMPTADAQGWCGTVAAAWRLMHEEAPRYVAGLSRGLAAITPLVPGTDGTLRSATARHAFGAIGVAPTDDVEAVAIMVLHEFQHTKLGAVLDLHDLFDRGYTPRARVGWHPEPRPVEAVFQGAYAHLAVADVWQRRAGRPDPPAVAGQRFRMYRRWTADAIDALRATGALTPLGQRFCDRMAQTLDLWAG